MNNSTDNKLTYNRIKQRAMEDARDYMPELPKVSERQLYADSARGIYIPQHFAESVNRDKLEGVTSDDLDYLMGDPTQDSYWDVWADVLDNAVLTDESGQQWTLHQDGDLWLVPAESYTIWETFQQDVEAIDAYEVAYESSEWDWVIYYHRAMELCQCVPSDVLNDAEEQWQEYGGYAVIDNENFGLFELAGQLAAIIVTREIAEAVESVKEELIDLAQTQMDNM